MRKPTCEEKKIADFAASVGRRLGFRLLKFLASLFCHHRHCPVSSSHNPAWPGFGAVMSLLLLCQALVGAWRRQQSHFLQGTRSPTRPLHRIAGCYQTCRARQCFIVTGTTVTLPFISLAHCANYTLATRGRPIWFSVIKIVQCVS